MIDGKAMTHCFNVVFTCDSEEEAEGVARRLEGFTSVGDVAVEEGYLVSAQFYAKSQKHVEGRIRMFCEAWNASEEAVK